MEYYKKLYHGTDADFETFAPGKIFFFDRPDAARFFGEHIIQCGVNLGRSLIVDLNGQSWGGFFLEDEPFWEAAMEFAIQESGGNPGNLEDEEYQYFHENGLTVNFLADWADNVGYDTIVVKNAKEDDMNEVLDQYVVMNRFRVMEMKKLI